MHELEKFADIPEKAVVNLKENGLCADLEAGTLYYIVLEKMREKLLLQYYRMLNETGTAESLETLKQWVTEEAEYQVKASEVQHGLGTQSKPKSVK